MKNLIIAGLMILTTLSYAQKNNQKSMEKGERLSSAAHVDKRLEKMKSELNLTEEQVKKIKPLLDEQAAKRKKMMENREKMIAERSEKREEMKEEMETMDSKLEEILTAEQFEKLKANRQDKVKTIREKKGDRKAGKRKSWN